jgi:hypothetical protein
MKLNGKYCILCQEQTKWRSLWTSNLDKTFCEYFGKQEEKKWSYSKDENLFLS